MTINVNNVVMHEIVNAECIRRRGGSAVLELRVATGDGHLAVIGARLPTGMREVPQFTAKTANLADPKSRQFVDHVAALHASKGLGLMTTFSHASDAIAKNGSLSASGREQRLRELSAKTLGALGTLAAAIAPHDARLKETEANLLAVPPADHGGVIEDSEARAEVRRLGPTERERLLANLGTDPRLDRVTLALRRSPVPLGSDSDKVDAAWQKIVARTRPAEWQKYSDERVATTWASELIGQLANRTLNPRQQQGADRLGREELYATLKPAGSAGLRLGNFTEHEAVGLEHRLAAKAAAAATA